MGISFGNCKKRAFPKNDIRHLGGIFLETAEKLQILKEKGAGQGGSFWEMQEKCNYQKNTGVTSRNPFSKCTFLAISKKIAAEKTNRFWKMQFLCKS